MKVDTLFFRIQEESPRLLEAKFGRDERGREMLARVQQERHRHVARAIASAIVERDLPLAFSSKEDEERGILTIEYTLPINVDQADKEYVLRMLDAGANTARAHLEALVIGQAQRYAALTGSCAPVISGALFDAAKAIRAWKPR